MNPSSIQVGSTVVMHFTLRLGDNSVAETTKKMTPARFTLTEASLQDPVESALVGKLAGEKVRVKLTPEQGYGPVLQENIYAIEKSKFPENTEPQLGDVFSFDQPNGQALPGVIKAIQTTDILVDFNHPLAGKALLCELEILDVIP